MLTPQAPDRRPSSSDGRGAFLVDVLQRLTPTAVVGDTGDIWLTGIGMDNRSVKPGDMFCCIPGSQSDGHDFAADAVERGASALLCERVVGGVSTSTPQLVMGTGGGRAAMAQAACEVLGNPARSLATVGITGTNGKTTTTYLLQAILQADNRPTAVVGTLLGARTTPEAPDLQRRLAAAVSENKACVALEVTSHALVQHRVDGYVHDVGVFTNLSQDHLDYHGSMEAYFAAKSLLFTAEHALAGVVNADDPYGARLLANPSIPLTAFQLADADDLEIAFGGSRFWLEGHEVSLHLTGEPNVRNALAAAAAARLLGVDPATVAAGLSSAGGVPGRFERVENALGIPAMVDYAHTPAALSESLRAMRLLAAGGRLVVVFGAGGDRDPEKRPLMGHAATTNADVVIVTSDNPRHEDPSAIIRQVLAGCDGPAELHIETDRRAAIALGLRLARPSDLLVIAGKGHETTQQIGDELHHFDDREILRVEATNLGGQL